MPRRRKSISSTHSDIVLVSPPRKSVHDWDYSTVPQDQLNRRAIFWPRGKGLGGSASMNAQIHQIGHRADFENWVRLGATGWGPDQVAPYFARAGQNETDATAPREPRALPIRTLRDPHPLTQQFLAAASHHGIPNIEDYNQSPKDGVSLARVNQRKGARFSVFHTHLRPALRRANLRLLTDAIVQQIHFKGKRAIGVSFVQRNGGERVAMAKEVILCAGAVGSPQILQLSGIGEKTLLESHGISVVHHAPDVGRNLQDHLAIILRYQITKPVSLAAEESLFSVLRYLVTRRGMLTSNVAEGLAFLRSSPHLPGPDLELLFAPVLYEHEALKPPSGHGFSLAVVLLQPQSKGQIQIASPDPQDKPKIQPEYLTDTEGHDVRTLLFGMRLARKIGQDSALAPLRGVERAPGVIHASDEALTAFIRQEAHTLYHPVGTCRMGTDAGAVVDPRLRVCGIEGLRVVDASVMPSIVRAHTNATTVMVAERAAEWLLGTNEC